MTSIGYYPRKALIVVDNARRDLLPSRLLEKGFQQLGVRAEVCSKRDVKLAFRKLLPHAVLMPRADWGIARDLGQLCRLYITPSEGARLTPETMMSVFLGRTYDADGLKVQLDQSFIPISNFDYIRKIYLWGLDTERFLKGTGFFRDEQLIVAGNPRLDIYRNAPKPAPRANREDFTIGVAFSVKSTSFYEGRHEYAKLLFNLNPREKLPVVPPGRHWEDYAWRDFAILRRMMWILRDILNNTKYKVHFRIGPFENIADYEFLAKMYPGRVTIQEREGQLFDFLKDIDMMLTCWSTTGLEALLMNIPVIAIPLMIDYEYLTAHVEPKANGFDTFLRCYHTPRSHEEVIKMIHQAREGRLALSQDPEFLKTFLKNIYHWPSEKSASHTIIEDIAKDLEGYDNSAELNQLNPGLKFPNAIESVLKVSPIRTPAIKGLELVKAYRSYLEDKKTGSFESARAFFDIRSVEVDELVRKTPV